MCLWSCIILVTHLPIAPAQMSPSSPKYSPTSPVSPSSPKYCKRFIFDTINMPIPLKLLPRRRIPPPVSHRLFSRLCSCILITRATCCAAPAYCKCIHVFSEFQKVTFSSPRLPCIQPDVTAMVAFKSCSKRCDSPWAFIQHLAVLGVSVLIKKIYVFGPCPASPAHSFQLPCICLWRSPETRP